MIKKDQKFYYFLEFTFRIYYKKERKYTKTIKIFQQTIYDKS